MSGIPALLVINGALRRSLLKLKRKTQPTLTLSLDESRHNLYAIVSIVLRLHHQKDK